MKYALLILLTLCFVAGARAQTTVTIRPHFNGKESLLFRLDSTNPGWSSSPYMHADADPDSTSPIYNYLAWTFSGIPGVTRNLVCFTDLTNPAVIPTGAIVTSAKLYLYGIPSTPTGDYGNSTYPGSPYTSYGDNSGWLYELATPFNPLTTCWNTQPNVKHTDSVAIPPSTSQWGTSDTLDVTSMVTDMIATGNTGFEIRLRTEILYREHLYASSRYADSTLHPALVVTFDTVAVVIKPPVVNLGNDTILCSGDTLTLQSSVTYIDPTYLWNTGSTTPAIIVTKTGQYWLTVTTNDSSASDTINVTFKPKPVIFISSKDTIICIGDSARITGSAPEQPFVTYLWNTGSTDSSIYVSDSGTYILTVTESGCIATDSIHVSEGIKPYVNLGPDTLLCNGTEIQLSANPDTALWSTGVTAQSISVIQAGIYWASVSTLCGIARDTINVSYQPCNIWLPSAFTPNDDGRNDIIRPVGTLGLYTDFALSIYNRWGNLVYYSKDIYSGWDGTFNGIKQDGGTFYYMMSYTFQGKKGMMKGDITLIR